MREGGMRQGERGRVGERGWGTGADPESKQGGCT